MNLIDEFVCAMGAVVPGVVLWVVVNREWLWNK